MDEHDEDTSSWRDDLRVEIAYEYLSGVVASVEVDELDLPHIVICRDEESGAQSYSGPFADGMSAMVFADRESALDRALNDGAPLSFVVAALYPTQTDEPV